jgi:hypothetical protein
VRLSKAHTSLMAGVFGMMRFMDSCKSSRFIGSGRELFESMNFEVPEVVEFLTNSYCALNGRNVAGVELKLQDIELLIPSYRMFIDKHQH